MNKARSERRRREKNNNHHHHHHQVLHYWLQHNSNDNNKHVKCSNKILESWTKAEQYKSLKQETNKLSFWSLSLPLSKADHGRASEHASSQHATQDCETKDRKRDAAGDAQTASKRASAHARGVPQKNQIYIVNLGNFILNALGFGWVLCAARRIHSFIGEISKHHIYIYI